MAHLLLDAVAHATVVSSTPTSSIFLHEKKSTHTVTCWFTNANITALTIALQGSDDNRGVSDANAKWFPLHEPHQFTSYEITDKRAMLHITTESPVKRVRIDITTLTDGAGSDTVTVKYEEGNI